MSAGPVKKQLLTREQIIYPIRIHPEDIKLVLKSLDNILNYTQCIFQSK